MVQKHKILAIEVSHNNTHNSVIGTLLTFGNERASAHQNTTQKSKYLIGPKFRTCELLYLNILTTRNKYKSYTFLTMQYHPLSLLPIDLFLF
jgi:hypothetical protein